MCFAKFGRTYVTNCVTFRYILIKIGAKNNEIDRNIAEMYGKS